VNAITRWLEVSGGTAEEQNVSSVTQKSAPHASEELADSWNKAKSVILYTSIEKYPS